MSSFIYEGVKRDIYPCIIVHDNNTSSTDFGEFVGVLSTL